MNNHTASARRLILSMLAMLALACSTSFAADTDPAAGSGKQKEITFGFFPIVSTVALFKRFSPLRDYLSESLNRPISLKTAKNFPTFLQRTDERQYDIVVTAPHFAVRAADSGKYVIRATSIKDVSQLFVVRKDSTIRNIEALAGKKIGTPPKSALMTMMGKRYLSEAGLSGGKQPVYRAYTSHNASIQALIGMEVEAVIASSNIIRKAIKRGEPIRVLQAGKSLPNMAFLVASDLDAELGDTLTEILVGMGGSEKGKKTLKQLSFPGYRAVNARDYEPARSYMELAVTNMKKSGKLK